MIAFTCWAIYYKLSVDLLVYIVRIMKALFKLLKITNKN